MKAMATAACCLGAFVISAWGFYQRSDRNDLKYTIPMLADWIQLEPAKARIAVNGAMERCIPELARARIRNPWITATATDMMSYIITQVGRGRGTAKEEEEVRAFMLVRLSKLNMQQQKLFGEVVLNGLSTKDAKICVLRDMEKQAPARA